jgi:hypothetical protein
MVERRCFRFGGVVDGTARRLLALLLRHSYLAVAICVAW